MQHTPYLISQLLHHSQTALLGLQALSYYKIFGYPTGLGALLVHKKVAPMLLEQKSYFGGGTVAVSTAEEDFFRQVSLIKEVHTVFPPCARQGQSRTAQLQFGMQSSLCAAHITHCIGQLLELLLM